MVFKKLYLFIVLICLLIYIPAFASIPKSTLKIPNYAERVINDIDASITRIKIAQTKLDKLITKLDYYTAYQGTEGKGKDWTASMVMAYEFKQISTRNLASVVLVKQMLYLHEGVFSTYLLLNFHLILGYFTELTSYSMNVIEANYEFIQNATIVKESKEGIKEVEKIHKYLVEIFSHFVKR